MVAPALDTIATEFKITTGFEKALVMSIFLLAYAIGPFLLGPLSEIFGRVVVLQSANMVFLLFNTVCGFAKSKEQMMAFRFLSGLGGSAPQAVRPVITLGSTFANCESTAWWRCTFRLLASRGERKSYRYLFPCSIPWSISWACW
jgi:MFS family permease